MKRLTPYLKMRVIGAVDSSEGRTCRDRIKRAAELVFNDEEGRSHRFTWRTISTWYYRFKTGNTTDMIPKDRSDKGKTRKVTPEELLEAINEAKPHFKSGITPPRASLYRLCIEKGFLQKNKVAPTTFYRLVREFDLLDTSEDTTNRRLAFAMPHANDLWQGDTMFGPHVRREGKAIQTKLILFIDDASRVVCHGQFFFSEKVDDMSETLRIAFYKRGVPRQIYVDNGSIYRSAELSLICARIGCILRHTPVRDGASKGYVAYCTSSVA